MHNKIVIALGGDHAGYKHKQAIAAYLSKSGYEVKDFGPFSEQSVDYPDFAHPVAKSVDTGKISLGIVVCGSGNGVCMVVNKYKNVRGALCWKNEIAKLARTHNDANVLCIPARFVSEKLAKSMVKIFIETSFEGGRHAARVNKI